MRFPSLFAVAALGAIALAACGSGGSYASSSASTKPASPMAIATPGTVAVQIGDTSLGKVLVDANGRTLYGLMNDNNGTPTCVDACASTWPPLTVDGTNLPAHLDATIFSVVSRSDGSHQLKAGKWPLYRFAGDAAPGDTNGQGSGGVWFVVTPNGTLHKG
jgi:predicted lipoprotein with Yx(FWY)xxD motif